MKIFTIIFIIINILLVNGLEYQHVQPGVLVEIYGKVGMIDDYFHVAFRVNFSGFHLKEISDLRNSVVKLCSEIKWKLKEEHDICRNYLADFHQNFRDESEDLLKTLDTKNQLHSNSYRLFDLNKLYDGEQDQNIHNEISNLVVVDFTYDILPNIYEDATTLAKSLDTLRAVVSSMENNIEPVDEKINQHFDILEKFMKSCNKYLSELKLIISQAQNHKVNPRLLKNISLKDILDGKTIANDAKHIIDLNTINAKNVENLGQTAGVANTQTLIKTAVYKEDGVSYIIMSLPLSKDKIIDNLEIIKLKPLPKMENNILTFIKVEPNFYIHNIKFERPNYKIRDLNCCYSYNDKYFCEYFNNTNESSTPCVTDIFEKTNKDFCQYYGCKLSFLENFGANIIELQDKFSYLFLTDKEVEAIYTGGSFKNIKLTLPIGTSLIHSKIPITLKIEEKELKFKMDMNGKVMYPYDFDFHFYDLVTPTLDKNLEKGSTTSLNTRLTDMTTFEEIYKFSSYVVTPEDEKNKKNDKELVEKPKDAPEDEPLYIVLTKILITAFCISILLILFFRYVLKYKFLVNLKVKAEKEPLQELDEK